MRILLDTNILTRIVNHANPDLRDKAEAALTATRNAGRIPCLVPQNLYEFWSVATRPVTSNGLGMSPQQARDEVDELLPLFPLLRDERSIFEHWLTLVTNHIVSGRPSHDARLVAAMIRHGITHLLTFNPSDFKRFTQIVVVSSDAAIAGTA